MKKYILLIAVVLVLSVQIFAQSITNYTVTRSTGNTYNSIGSTGTPLSSWRNNTSYIEDDNRSYQHDIGFDFWYNGVRYTKFSVSTNGYMDFSSSTATGGADGGAYSYVNSYFSTSGGTLIALAPFYDDQTTQGAVDPLGESIKYLLTGTSPDRILTVEWINMAVYQNTTPDMNYQVKIYEKTGVIEYRYGTMINGTPAFTYTCGINGTVNTQLRTQQTANTATFSATAQNNLSTIPESNSKLTFTPPTPTAVSGTLSFGTVTSTSIVLNWTNWASNEVGYAVYYSTDNVNFDYLSQTVANTVTYTASSLLPGTTYYFKIMAVTEGGVSDPLTGSQATSAPTTIYSAATGDWDNTATWVGGVVPTSASNVVIKNGHTVSIRNANATCYNLTVGEGTSGILQYIGNTARTLTVTGDLTINVGGTFTVNTGSNRTHLLYHAGNIVNNGTFNLYADSGSLCNITFNKNGNQTISGTGATTKFNLITLNMGTSNANILDVTSSTFSSGATANYLTLTNGTFKYSVSGTTTITPYTTAYVIPATGGFWINSVNATVNTGASLTATGNLTLSAGTLNIGNASDENLISGGGQITVSGGTLNIAGRLDRTYTTTLTRLDISDGTINVPVYGSTSTTISPFEMSVNGSIFNMSGGTIVIPRAGGGTSYLGIKTTNGTLNVTGGTLQIGNTSTPASSIISINSLVSFANVNVNSSNATARLTNDFTVFNDFTITAGTFNANNYNFTLGRNWTNSGTFTTGTGVFSLNGTGNQNITKSTGESFYNLTINKSSGEVVLLNNISVTNILNLSSGNINCGSNTITLGTSTSVTGTLTYTSGNIVGKFKRWINTPATSIIFPIGSQTENRKATLLFNNLTSGALTTEFISSDAGSNGLPLIDGGFTVQHQFSEGYWNLVASDGLASSNFDIELNGEGFDSYNLLSSTRLIKRVDESSAWTLSGTHVDLESNIAKRSGMGTLSAQIGFASTICSDFVATEIIGDTTVCINDASVSYSVTNYLGNSYNWSCVGGNIISGQGTNSILITWGLTGGDGEVSVVEQNNCGDNNSSIIIPIIINPFPTTDIVGESVVSQNQSGVTYSVNDIVGYSYAWSVDGGTISSGSGTSEISVNWGSGTSGNVYVTVTPTCGSGENKSLAITIRGPILSATSGNWTSTSTWVGGVVPTVNDYVTISTGHTVVMNGPGYSCYSLTINGTANWAASYSTYVGNGGINISSTGNITGTENGSLTSTGGLTVNSTLTSNSVSLVLQTNASTIAGTGSIGKLTINANTINNGDITVRSVLQGSATLTQGENSSLTLNMQQVFVSGLVANAIGNTVIYESTSTQYIKGITYNNLNLISSGTKTLAGSITVNDSLVVSDCTFDVSSYNYSISITGNWIATNTVFNKRFGNVTFNGDETQTLSGINAFENLIINNSGNGVDIGNDITISGVLTLTDGIITTNSNNVIVSNTGYLSISGYSSNSFINGNLRRYIATNTNTYAFPVGVGVSSSNYNRLDFVNNNITGVSYLTASVNTISETGNNIDLRLNTTQNSLNFYNAKSEIANWTLTANASKTGGDFGIHLYTSNISNLTDNEFFVISRSSSSSDYADWASNESTTTIPTDNSVGRTVASGYAKRSGIDSFESFTIGLASQATVQFSQVNSNGYELNGIEEIDVELNFALPFDVTIDYAISGTATPNTDFVLASGTLTFNNGETLNPINLNLINDVILESDETVIISLSNPSAGLTLGSVVEHTFTINDDDSYREIAFETTTSSAYENETTPEYWEWTKQITSTTNAYPRSMIVDSDKNVVLMMSFEGTVTIQNDSYVSSGASDMLLVKYNPNGTILWVKQAGGTDVDTPLDIQIDSDDNIYVTGGFKTTAYFGTTSVVSSGGQDAFLVKYSSSGDVIWAKNVAWGTDVSRVEAIELNNNEIILSGLFKGTVDFGGTTLSVESSALNNFITKLDTSGAFIWATKIKSNNINTKINRVVSSNGYYYFAGSYSGSLYIGADTYTSLGLKDLVVLKVDSDGNILWVKTGGGTKDDFWNSIDHDAEGNIFLTGSIYGSGTISSETITINGSSDMIYAKYDADGNLIFAANKGGAGADIGVDVSVLNNYVHLTGAFTNEITWGSSNLNSSSATNYDAFIGLTDINGNEVFAKQIYGSSYEQGSVVMIENDGNAYISGYNASDTLCFNIDTLFGSGNIDCFVSKYKYASTIPLVINTIDYDNEVTVDYTIIGGNATNGNDYTLSNGSVTIQAGDSKSYINAVLNDDLTEETSENIQVQLSNPTNAVLGGNDEYSFSILDNDTKPIVQFENASQVVFESVSEVECKLSIDHVYDQEVTVDYAITGGDAINGQDFNLSNGTITIPIDSLCAYITIPLICDSTQESDETLIITLSNPSNATIGEKLTYTLLIYNAPTPPIAGISCNYGVGSLTLTAESSTGTCAWYDSEFGGNLLATGNSYITPELTTTTTYYAASINVDNTLYFPNKGGYTKIPNNPSIDLSGNLTIEMLINVKDFTTRHYLFDKWYSGEGRIAVETSGVLVYYYGNCDTYCTSYRALSSVQTLPLNEWVHIALVRDNTNGILAWYINGVKTVQTQLIYTPSQTTKDILIGNMHNGEIDEIRIWNKARTSTEILNDMSSSLLGNEANLLAYYDMDNGKGLVLEDLTSSNFDGYLLNMDSLESWKYKTIYNQSSRVPVVAEIYQSTNFLGNDTTALQSVVLDAGSGDSYIWNDGSSLSTLTVENSGLYWVSVSDDNCILRDSVQVNITLTSPSVENVCRAGSGTVTLEAESGTNEAVWYDAPTAGNLLHIGEVYTSPKLTSTTNYYAAAANINKSLDFNATADYAVIPNNVAMNMSGNLTIEMKIKVSDFSSRHYLLDKWYSGEGRISVETDGTLHYYYGCCDTYCSTWQSLSSVQSIPLNEWTHIAIVRDNTNNTLTWYINGVKTVQTIVKYTSIQTTKNILIGNMHSGEIDEIRIWNRARSASELIADKNILLLGLEPGLIAYYNMDNGRGLVLEDKTNNGFDGYLLNMDSTTVWKSNSIIEEGLRAQLQVTINDNPVELGNDTTVESSLVLDATNEYSTYLWNDNSTVQTLNVTSSGEYWVSVVDGNGCFDIDTIDVTVNSAKALVLTEEEINEINNVSYQFENFEAKLNGDIIDLSWLIENEMSTYYYTIEKTIDLEKFEVLDIIFAGEKTSLVDYVIFDDNPHKGVSYYRLKQTDLYGKSIYSDLIRVEYGQDSKQIMFKIYPNPVQYNQAFYVNMTGLKSNDEVLVIVIDALGREMYSKVIFTNSEGSVLEAIDPHGRLEPGTYFIVGSSKDEIYSKKLIIR